VDVDRFRASPIGDVVRISGHDPRFAESYEDWGYVPHPLPDQVHLSPETVNVVLGATLALGRLDQAGVQLQNPAVLRRPTLRREAQSTSALEGTYAALADVLEADLDADQPKTPELREILNYVRAAEHAYAWMKEGRQITLGLLCELHAILLTNTRADGPETGRIRQLQVLIGSGGRIADARFVPPPPGDALRAGLTDLLAWLNRKQEHAAAGVVDCALAHYQFETLHPFHDGNGRLGRLLVVLQLLAAGVLTEPVLTVSPWFEARRSRYQDELQHLSESGDFDRWIAFFSEGIQAQAEASTLKIKELQAYQETARSVARGEGRHNIAVDIANDLIERPVTTVSSAASRYGVSFVAANKAIARLVQRGLLVEITGKDHDRVFRAQEVLRILER
jgi:Fic family protein